jgi:large repetitive protein
MRLNLLVTPTPSILMVLRGQRFTTMRVWMLPSAITLEAWVYWDGSSAKGLLGRWKGAGSLKSYLLFANTSTAVQFLISNNGSTNYFVSTSTSISNGWNHIVGTADGSKVKVYLNGAFENEAAAAISIFTSSLPVEIGRLSDDSTAAYPNAIALPRIYNRALTATEVARNYNADKSKFGL